MSIAYKKRKKAIRDEKRRIGLDNLEYGHIPKGVFYVLQRSWKKLGQPIGSLGELVS